MSWTQLIAILQEARDTYAEERVTPPLACPNDGEPLDYHPGKGVLHCKYCGWRTVGRPHGQ